MSNFTNDDVVKALGNLTVLEMIALTKELEAKWGVKAEPAPVKLSDLPRVEKGAVEQTEFDVILKAVASDKKIGIIKVIREISGVGLKESKDLAEAAPKVIRSGVSRSEADDFKSRLEQAGAEVEVK